MIRFFLANQPRKSGGARVLAEIGLNIISRFQLAGNIFLKV